MLSSSNKLDLINISYKLVRRDYMKVYKNLSDSGKISQFKNKVEIFNTYSIGEETRKVWEWLKKDESNNLTEKEVEEIQEYILEKKLNNGGIMLVKLETGGGEEW